MAAASYAVPVPYLFERLLTEEMRQAAIALLTLGFFASVVKSIAERWRSVLQNQDRTDQLQNHLWGWESVRKELQDASIRLRWSSYLRLGAAALATCVFIAAAARALGFAMGLATVMPLLSLGGAVVWREFGDLTVNQAIRDWHSGALPKRLLAWVSGAAGSTAASGPMPTVVLTGFLGAGKTTLLNRLLREGGERGRKFAVIENEVGAVGIDGQLVAEGMTAEERQAVAPSFVELSDGCVCCTVRGDLQDALHSLLPKLHAQGVDTLLIETTGLAEPGPVVQTFLADQKLREAYRVDGVVTVVDAKHVMQHLESSEATEERRARDAGAKSRGREDDEKDKPLSAQVRDLSAQVLRLKKQQQFAQGAIMAARASADPKQGEKAAVYAMAEAEKIENELKNVRERFAACRARLREPGMGGRKSEAAQQIAFADKVVINKIDLVKEDDAADVNTAIVSINPHAEVITASNADVSFDWVLAPRPLTADKEPPLSADAAAAASSELCPPCAPSGQPLPNITGAFGNRSWHGPKGGVVSISLRTAHQIDLPRFNNWVFRVLEEHGSSIYRYKGVLAVSNDDRRYVFQGVHMVFTGRPSKETWPNDETAERVSQLVMIGRNLPLKELEDGFRTCLATEEARKGRESLAVE
jgi:G3E family GTPase